MAKTMSMTRQPNHGDNPSPSSSSSSRKRFNTFDEANVAPWSNVNHYVLFVVMMQLGFVDFFAFSGVCKSWRSFALSNRNTFMASKPPLFISNLKMANKDDRCYLEVFEGKRFKTILPHFTNRICIGSTCGYLILFGKETCDFWLVNPITRHELHFPDFPNRKIIIRGILVFSPSGWVFVVLYKEFKPQILFYIMGKQGWNHVYTTVPIIDLQFFKGKIYTLHTDSSLGELRLDLMLKQKWTLLKTNNSPNLLMLSPRLVSSGENLYLIDPYSNPERVVKLDFDEMKWVSAEKTLGEYTIFISFWNYSTEVKSWLDFQPKYKSRDYFFHPDKNQR